MQEAFRVLKPGGRFAVSDVVTRGEVPPGVRENMLLWVGCIAGALEDEQYRAKLARVGFERIEIEPTRVYDIEDARTFLSGQGIDVDAIAPAVDGKFMSAFHPRRETCQVPMLRPRLLRIGGTPGMSGRKLQMKTIQVFDPALCCSTGVCGADVDQALVIFSADVAWAKLNGAQIDRFNLAQEPVAFAENNTVERLFGAFGRGSAAAGSR